MDLVVDALAVGDEPAVLLVGEQVANHANGELRLLVQTGRRLALLRLGLDLVPDVEQAAEIGLELFLGGAFGGRAHDHAVLRGLHALQQRLEPLARVVAQPAADALQVLIRRQHDVAAREAQVGGQPRALAPHRVLRDLHHDRLAGLEQLLDARRGAVDVLGAVVDLAGVQHAVSAAADVDERGLHARKHVLHAPEVDVADHRGGAGAGHVVLHEHVFLEDRDLIALAVLGDHHELVGDPRWRHDRVATTTAVSTGATACVSDAPSRATRGDLLLDRSWLRRLPLRGLAAALAAALTATLAAALTAAASSLAVAGRVDIGRGVVSLGRRGLAGKAVGIVGVDRRRLLPSTAPASAAAATLLRSSRRALAFGGLRRVPIGRLVLGVAGLGLGCSGLRLLLARLRARPWLLPRRGPAVGRLVPIRFGSLGGRARGARSAAATAATTASPAPGSAGAGLACLAVARGRIRRGRRRRLRLRCGDTSRPLGPRGRLCCGRALRHRLRCGCRLGGGCGRRRGARWPRRRRLGLDLRLHLDLAPGGGSPRRVLGRGRRRGGGCRRCGVLIHRWDHSSRVARGAGAPGEPTGTSVRPWAEPLDRAA